MKCAYCSKEIEPGTGIMFVRKSGQIRYYCSNRCYRLDVLHKKKHREVAAAKASVEAQQASKA
ncbi:MAG: 50S ribosomal protein L24e [Candidatus Micrarchaeia archaeon]|jgi:large subunit ribosomal protein L24e